MSDRELPGIHTPAPASGNKIAWITVGVIVAVFVAVAMIVGAVNGNAQKPYDANNADEAISQCEAAVEKQLKSPTTAKFHLTATGYDTWTVTGTVDSQNSFGAMVRSETQCTVIVDGDSIKVRVDQLD